ncbi:MAG: metallophosphoesterase [Myxococcota bacterium]
MFAAFLFVLVALLVALTRYVTRRAEKVFDLSRRRARGLFVVGLAGIALLFGSRAFADALGEWAGPLALLGAVPSLAVLMAGGLLLQVDAVRSLGWLFRKVRKRFRSAPDEAPAAEGTGRREFIERVASGAALGVGASAGLWGVAFGRHDYAIEEVPIRIPGLPRTLDGFTLAQLSDVHFGTFVGETQRRDALDLVRQVSPDLVVMTGDLIDHDARYVPLLGHLTQDLAELARFGVAAIPGNHDHYAGVDDVLGTLRQAGAQVLLNAGKTIGDAGGAFALLGVDDRWSRRTGGGPDLDRALSMVPRDLPRILLAHQPAYFREGPAGRVALQLSGHTHGGQISLGWNPAYAVLPYGYVRGRYEHEGSQLYVNRGFGTAGPPSRVESAPEVTKLVLVAG